MSLALAALSTWATLAWAANPTAKVAGQAATAEATSPRLAWVLGNADYKGMTALKNPAHDAQDMCAALQRLGFETYCHTDIADKASLIKRFNEFAERLTPASQGLIYYAGHAVQINGRNYLVPTQASVQGLADVPEQLADLQVLMDALKRKGNSFNVVILDACRQDPFAGTSTSDTVARAAMSGNLLRSIGPQMAASKGPLGYGLAPIQDAPSGSIVFYATGSNDVALDGLGRNGLLTKHLLQHIETPGIAVEDMIKRVSAGVQVESKRYTRKAQTPFVYSSFTGEFCFAKCGGLLPAANAPAKTEVASPPPASPAMSAKPIDLAPLPRTPSAQPMVPALF